jgi:bacterial/archaeal transporter family-2 protein
MLTLFAILGGALSAITVAQNGDLALYLGTYRATVLVHVVGLITILLFLLARREKFRWDPATPRYAYLGGALGVFTVLGCNASFAALGVSVPVALMLLGQTMLGAAIDQFGLFGAQKHPFQPRHLISLGLIACGIAVMIAL